MKVYIDGQFVDEEKAKISVFDHGVLYGDGVFEGLRVYDGGILFLKEHVERLYNSAKGIMLKIPIGKEKLEEAIKLSVRENNVKNGYIRVCVTRGVGDLGLDPRKCKEPTLFIIVSDIKLYPKENYEKGLEVIIASTRRNLPQALNPCIKSLNYLNNILAKIEAIKANVDEAIFLNEQGYVVECTGENIFIVKDNCVITPPIYVGALSGITRKSIFKLVKENLNSDVIEKLFTDYEIYTADECFLTGTAAGIVPVVKINGREIGDGRPGKVTRLLIRKFEDLIRNSTTNAYE